ncbi:MAG TPA: YtxH domain-containing protein [Pseudogracilibacillus sp.]|nr:YtxH domain-containing protein [Pseudogracilibacillus sp.]
MGKRKLLSGMMIGAIIGGAVALLNEDARKYAQTKVTSVKGKTSYLIKHPAEAVRTSRMKIDHLNDHLVNSFENTVNALEQVEQTLDRLVQKKDA